MFPYGFGFDAKVKDVNTSVTWDHVKYRMIKSPEN